MHARTELSPSMAYPTCAPFEGATRRPLDVPAFRQPRRPSPAALSAGGHAAMGWCAAWARDAVALVTEEPALAVSLLVLVLQAWQIALMRDALRAATRAAAASA